MKKIVLLTNEYPYGMGESFIEPEMALLSPEIDMDIVCMRENVQHKSLRKLPKNVHVKNFLQKWDKVTYCRKMGEAFFSAEFRAEIADIRKRRKVCLIEVKQMLGHFARARYVAYKLENEYHELLQNNQVIIYSYWMLHGLLAAATLSKKYGVKVVARAHGVDLWDNKSHFEIVPGRPFMFEHMQKAYVCSQSGCDFLRLRYPAFADKIDCSYLGTLDYGMNADVRTRKPFCIVSCARMVPLKRIHLLVDALCLIKEHHVHWIHFGDGPEENMICEHLKHVPSNVTYDLHGNVPHDLVMSYYMQHGADLFVNTSNSEGIPVSIMEAISFGIPVVATDVGGTKEIVGPEVGVMLPVDFAVEELARKIRDYITMSETDYEACRQSARAFWQENFSAEKNYQLFYQQLLEE